MDQPEQIGVIVLIGVEDVRRIGGAQSHARAGDRSGPSALRDAAGALGDESRVACSVRDIVHAQFAVAEEAAVEYAELIADSDLGLVAADKRRVAARRGQKRRSARSGQKRPARPAQLERLALCVRRGAVALDISIEE